MAAKPKPPWKRIRPPPVPAPRSALSLAQARLDTIADHHQKDIDRVGGSWGDCVECCHAWPCPTYLVASGERDPEQPWDPADDGDVDGFEALTERNRK